MSDDWMARAARPFAGPEPTPADPKPAPARVPGPTSGGNLRDVSQDPRAADPASHVLLRDANGSMFFRDRTPADNGAQPSGQAGGNQGNQTGTQVADGGQQTQPGAPQKFTLADGREFTLTPERLEQLQELETRDIARKAGMPADAGGYEAKLPDGFSLPNGIEASINVNDPALADLRNLAYENGWSQDQFKKLLAIDAQRQGRQAQMIANAAKIETDKLGPTGASRIDAVATWWNSMTGDDGKVLGQILRMAPTANTVKAFERLINKYTSQGVGAHSGRRDTPDQPNRLSDDAIAKMSYSERKEYARQFAQPEGPAR